MEDWTLFFLLFCQLKHRKALFIASTMRKISSGLIIIIVEIKQDHLARGECYYIKILKTIMAARGNFSPELEFKYR